MNEQRKKAMAAAITQIEKQFGKGSIMRLGDEPLAAIEVVPTGSLALDVALGVGGLPRGRIVEIYGPESSGKTTQTLEVMAQAQKLGLNCAFIDAEHALDTSYAAALGVDVDNLFLSQPDTGEEALEITDVLVRSGAVDVIVVDSVAALVPKSEIEGDMGAQSVGVQARLMSSGLRKLAGSVSNSGCLLIFINQIRMKIGVMFGNPETTTGGNALKFYASVRLDVRGTEQIKDGDVAIGKRTKVKVVKNKVAAPHRSAEYVNTFGRGINRAEELVVMGAEHGFVEKTGAWYSFDGTKIGQGSKNAAQFFIENPTIAEDLDKKLRQKLILGSEGNAQKAKDIKAPELEPDQSLDLVAQ